MAGVMVQLSDSMTTFGDTQSYAALKYFSGSLSH